MTPTGSAGQYCLDDFELIRVIGRGSYAKVLMVELKRTKRIYAMKVIKKTLVTDDEVRKEGKKTRGVGYCLNQSFIDRMFLTKFIEGLV